MKKYAFLAVLIAFAAVLPAEARWNEAWSERRTILLDTSASGVELATPLEAVAVPVRLHSGNFDFAAARPDGGDLRFIAGDDRTPLKHHIEQFDSVNELALVWVHLPQLAPRNAGNRIYLYFGNPQAEAETQAGGAYDHDTVAVFHFRAGEERPQDATANGNHAAGRLALEPAGLLAASGRFRGEAMTVAASPSLTFSDAKGFSFSTWLKWETATGRAGLYRQGALEVAVEGGRLLLTLAGVRLSGGALAPNAWHHVAVTVADGQAVLYVDGVRVAAAPARLPDLEGGAKIGEGLVGLLDEVHIVRAARSADWIRAAALGQGAEGRLVSVAAANEDGAGGGPPSYLGILIDNLTVDAWMVIIILMLMFILAGGVMVAKAMMVGNTDRDNRRFLQRFRQASHDFLDLAQDGAHPHSSLYRLYLAGQREVKKRVDGRSEANLSGAAIDAIKAAVDADLVRETHRLNAKMVLLTIAISGGPFLGLLGTVVGVMITFAAIAAAGDVNVNAIAPGIAAALLATVAGLAVAIPSLFGYNYLASRIRNISADMQIFVDEFITRVAEAYSR